MDFAATSAALHEGDVTDYACGRNNKNLLFPHEKRAPQLTLCQALKRNEHHLNIFLYMENGNKCAIFHLSDIRYKTNLTNELCTDKYVLTSL